MNDYERVWKYLNIYEAFMNENERLINKNKTLMNEKESFMNKKTFFENFWIQFRFVFIHILMNEKWMKNFMKVYESLGKSKESLKFIMKDC